MNYMGGQASTLSSYFMIAHYLLYVNNIFLFYCKLRLFSDLSLLLQKRKLAIGYLYNTVAYRACTR